MNKIQSSAGGLLAALVLFFALNMISQATLSSARIDVTEEQLFTLSEGSVNIASELEEPIRLYSYFSESKSNEAPAFKSYAKRVRELLQEFALRSDGKIVVEYVDPEPFSDEEDRAVQAGLAGLPVDAAGELMYFGLIGRNAVDGEEVIPFFDPRKERFLEYDISRLIYSLANPDKQTVGVISSLPLQGAPSPNPMDPRGGTPPWQILPQMRNFFEVQMLESSVDEIPDSVDVLLLAHPKSLSEGTLYAIDQFVLGGGRVIALVDPHCEADAPPTDPSNPMAAMQADRSSDLGPLLGAWGVELVPSKVVGDRANALQVSMGGNRPRAVSFVTYIGLGPDEFDEADPVISELGQINVAFPGALRAAEGAGTEFSPLFRTSDEAMLIDQSRVQFMPNPEDLLTSFVPEGEPVVLAARISGDVTTAFPDGPPEDPAAAEEEADDEEGADESDGEDAAGHLAASTQPVNLVVVADADMLDDRFWISEERLGPILLGHRKTADNGDFVINVLDNLCGSNDLISVRAGSRFSRPFGLVEEIQREAEERYLAESQVLEQKLRDTEAKISELQRQKGDSDSFILSPEQAEEIERFREQQIETRKQLRDVQHKLRKDIERLGTQMKLANILGTPLLFVAVVLGIWWTRNRKHR